MEIAIGFLVAIVVLIGIFFTLVKKSVKEGKR